MENTSNYSINSSCKECSFVENHLDIDYYNDFKIKTYDELMLTIKRQNFKYYKSQDLISSLGSKTQVISYSYNKPSYKILLLDREYDISDFKTNGIDLCILVDNSISMYETQLFIKSCIYDIIKDIETSIFSIDQIKIEHLQKFRISIIMYGNALFEKFYNYLKLGSILDIVDAIEFDLSEKSSDLNTQLKKVLNLDWGTESYKIFLHFIGKGLKREEEKNYFELKETYDEMSNLDMVYSIVKFDNDINWLLSIASQAMEVDITDYTHTN